MGQETSCETRWCFNTATEVCRCTNTRLCHDCVRPHLNTHTEHPHDIVHLASASPLPPTVPKVTYGRLLYRTPEGNTEVFEGRIDGHAETVAIKVQYCKTTTEVNVRQEEAALQRSIRHPHICRCYQSFLDPEYSPGFKHVIVMEYGLFGDLENDITRRKEVRRYYSEGELMDTMFAVTSALAHLESMNIAHRDVKPCNVLLCEGHTPKLADFGLTVQGNEQLRTQQYQVVGTVLYLSPAIKQAYLDMWEGRNTTGEVKHNPFKSDVFSLGLTCLALATLEAPSGLNNLSQGTEALQKRISKRVSETRYSSKVKQVLNVMLHAKEELRPTFPQLLEMMKALEFSAMVEEESPPESPVEECTQPAAPLSPSTHEPDFLLSLQRDSKTWTREVASLVQRSVRGKEAISALIIETRLKTEDVRPLCCVIGSNPGIERIELDHTSLGDFGVKSLSFTLHKAQHLRLLALGDNDITLEGIKALAKVLPSLSSLLVLRLWKNRVGWEGAVHLSLAIAHVVTLQELFLGTCELGKEGVRYLSKAIEKLTDLRILSLMDNGMGDEGVRHLSLALPRLQYLQRLYLEGNEIGRLGVGQLASVLGSLPALVSLTISRNHVEEEDLVLLKSTKTKAKIQA